jgi:hypothetical protein
MTRRAFFAALAAPFVARFRKLFGMRTPPRSIVRMSIEATRWAAQGDGVSVRFVRSFDPNGKTVTRCDVLYGFGLYGVGSIKPEHTCRIEG